MRIRATSSIEAVCFLSKSRLHSEYRLITITRLSTLRYFRVLNDVEFNLCRCTMRLARTIRIKDVRAAMVSLRNDRSIVKTSTYFLADNDIGIRLMLQRIEIRKYLNEISFETYFRNYIVIIRRIRRIIRVAAHLILRIRLSIT